MALLGSIIILDKEKWQERILVINNVRRRKQQDQIHKPSVNRYKSSFLYNKPAKYSVLENQKQREMQNQEMEMILDDNLSAKWKKFNPCL